MTASIRTRGADLAHRCADAYSTERYRSWTSVAVALLQEGLTEREAEAVMRSKWTRWAADASEARYGKVPASAIVDWVKKEGMDSVRALTAEHFGEPAPEPASAPMSMADLLLERLNELATILNEPKWCPWRPSPEELEFHRSPVLAWLASPPCPAHAAADWLKLSPSGAVRFGEAWGYVQGVADSCNQTITELLDSMGIEPIPESTLLRRAG